jgi:hypothetical protein
MRNRGARGRASASFSKGVKVPGKTASSFAARLRGALARSGMVGDDCDKALKTLERVKGIEPSYSAWKSANFLTHGLGPWPATASGLIRATPHPEDDGGLSPLHKD